MHKTTKLVIGLIVILILLTSCTKESIIEVVPSEEQNQSTEPEQAGLQTGIKQGDLVTMNYILYGEDGRIITTNQKETAEKAGVKTYSTGPYQFIIGKSGQPKGFDEAIIGMEKGDQETLKIPPSTDKIIIELERINEESRIKTIPLKQRFEIDHYKSIFNKPPILNDVAANKDRFPWPYKVIAITNNSVMGEILIKEGQTAELPGTHWPSKATAISDRVIQFLQMPKQGQEITTEFGTATVNFTRSRMRITHHPEQGKEFFYTMPSKELVSPRYEFTVTEITPERFTIQRINWPEQEELTLEAEILDVIPAEEIQKLKMKNSFKK